MSTSKEVHGKRTC